MQLNEKNLRAGVLKYLVDPVVDIDTYTPKIQQDSIVVVMRVDANYDAGYDLSSFIDRLPFGVLDTEVREIPNTDGKYEVYVEMERDENFPDNIIRILQDVSPLCSEEDVEYVWRANMYGYDDEEPVELDADIIRERVRLVPEKQIKEFFEYSLESVRLDESLYIGNDKFAGCVPVQAHIAADLLHGSTELKHSLGRFYEAYKTREGVLVINHKSNCMLLRGTGE